MNIYNHILQAKRSGADLVKIQTYEPQDMIIDKNFVVRLKTCDENRRRVNFKLGLRMQNNALGY